MAQFIIGIDLGTTNSALAYASIGAADEESEVKLFYVSQLVNPGEVADLDLLPSTLYIPGPSEFVEGSLALPWNSNPPFITGRLARNRGIEPTRSVFGGAAEAVVINHDVRPG